jgi:hypothetical protein
MESAEHPGDFWEFWEFWEFADERAAERFAAAAARDPRHRELERRRREIVPEDREVSTWHQRL